MNSVVMKIADIISINKNFAIAWQYCVLKHVTIIAKLFALFNIYIDNIIYFLHSYNYMIIHLTYETKFSKIFNSYNNGI
jgi:hypothetical protein